MAGQQWRRRVMRHAAAGLGVTLLALGAPLVSAPSASAQGCTLEPYTNCRGQDLTKVDFTGADVRHGDFTGANFSGMTLRRVDFNKAKLDGANLSDVTFGTATDLRESSLTGANLEGASLDPGANLGGRMPAGQR
jgi:uncharacterized protein YjbI with pentapeptide repeats